MKKCAGVTSRRAIIALTLSIVLIFASASSLFAIEAELETALSYETAEILNDPKLLEESSAEAVYLAEDVTLNSAGDESTGLDYSNDSLTLDEIASTILSNELGVSIPATQVASQPISPFIDLAPPRPIPLRFVYRYAEGTIFPAPIGGSSFSFRMTPLSPPPDPNFPSPFTGMEISWPSTASSMKLMDHQSTESVVETVRSYIEDVDEFPDEGIFTFSVTKDQNTNRLPDYLNIIYSPANYELRIYVVEYEWGAGQITRAIVDATAVVVVPDSPNPSAPGVGTEVSELAFTSILEVNEDLYNPVCDVCRQPSWSSCICPEPTDPEPCKSCREYPCVCEKSIPTTSTPIVSTPTTPTPSPGPKTGDNANQSAYLTIMIVALAIMGASAYKLACPKGFARRKVGSSLM